MSTSRVEGFRLSPQQRAAWRRLQEDGPLAHGAACAVHLTGDLDEDALRDALRVVVDRHEILRTCFCSVPGMSLPVQVVQPPAAPRCEVHDLATRPAEERPAAIADLARALPAEPPAEGRLPLAACLVRLEPGEHLLLLRLPAVCADAASLANVVREIGNAYAARRAGCSCEAEPPAQYADLAEIFNELLESEGAAAGLAFWRAAGPIGDLDPSLPLRDPRQAGDGLSTAQREVAPPASWWERIATALEAELSDVLLAAWKVLLWRLGQQRPVVGRAFHGRSYEGLADAVGLFARHLPVSVDLRADLSFSEAVARVGAAVAEAEERQEYFDEDRLAAAAGEPGPRHFPFCFELQPWPAAFQAGGLTFEIRDLDACCDRFELRLRCLPGEGQGRLEIHYDPALYSERSAGQLLDAFVALVASAAAEPAARLGDLDLLSAAERERLREWNDTRVELPGGRGVHEHFEEQVERTPDRVAVVWDRGSWTYAELDRRANRVANALLARGLGAEDVVGVCLERSRELVVALLGVLKTGAAYLPLEPAGPQERSALMLDDAGARLVVSEAAWRGALPEAVEALRLSDLVAECGPGAEASPRRSVHPAQLAYVLYTSGSTGRPKGVMISHGSLVNYLFWVHREILAGLEALPCVTRPSFDASLKQIFAPLLHGREVWTLAPDALEQPARLLQALGERRGVGLNCVTSLWRAALDTLETGQAPAGGPAAVLVGGERLDAALLDRTCAALPGVAVWNLYGPTEATANATAGRLRAGGGVSLGRPVANARIYLLDPHGRLAPSDVPGEIAVGGAGLARGYRGLPALTAERFVPDPWSGEPGARLYRTGDLARFHPEGSLEFLGRIDHQVKLRGIRIELEEIEEVLRRHPDVADCAVAVREAGGGPRLVSYVVPANPAPPGERDLRAFLAGSLPEAMVPAQWVVMPALPRTAGGKVDRRALPDPEPVGCRRETHAASRSAVEEVLAQIWCDLLAVEQVDPRDNFYQLGGHSLLAVQLLSRIQQTFRVELSLRKVLEAESLAALSALVEAMRREPGSAPPLLTPLARRDDLPLSFAQERLWFLSQLEPDSSAYNIPATLRLRGRLDIRVLARAFDEVVWRHEVLRTGFLAVQGQPRCVVRPAAPEPLPVVDLAGLSPACREPEALRLSASEAGRPFALATDPLLRRCVLRLDDQDWVLLATCHHIVADGWSMRLLFQELDALYQTFSRGLAPRLPELPIQYADYAAWQRRWLQGDVLARVQEGWRRRLAGVRPTTLPADRPRPASFSSRTGAVLPFTVDPALTGALRALGRRAGTTSFMTLLAALQATLHSCTDAPEITLGIHALNRVRPETERVIGLFTNQLVLRTDLSGDPTYLELLERARETALDAFDQQEIPLNLIVEAVRPERDLGRNPLFQMMFPYQNLPELPEELAGLPCEPVRVDTNTAPFDLSVHMRETRQGLDGFLRYNTALYNASTMESFQRRLAVGLHTVTEHPEIRLSGLSALLRAADREQRRQAAAELEKAAGLRLARHTKRTFLPERHADPLGVPMES